MPWPRLIILGIIIGSNNLAAALALGALGQAARRLRVVFVFTLFEFFVPLVGILVGRQALRWVQHAGVWLGAGILVGLGLLMIRAGFRDRALGERTARRLTSWRGLFGLALGLSMDNLLIGVSLGLGQTVEPLVLATVIAICSATFTWTGIRLGHISRRLWEQVAQVGAGVLLLVLAVAQVAGWL